MCNIGYLKVNIGVKQYVLEIHFRNPRSTSRTVIIIVTQFYFRTAEFEFKFI